MNNTNPNNHILFLDGDRYPYGINQELVETALYLFDITLIKCQDDKFRKWFKPNFSKNPNFNSFDNDLWSCGFLIRRSAIEKIKPLVNGNLFNEFFNGSWGYEDMHLGDIASILNLSCGGFPSSVFLNGEIESFHQKEENRKQNEIRKLLRMALKIKFGKIPIND